MLMKQNVNSDVTKDSPNHNQQGSTRANQTHLKDGKINSPNNRSNVVKSIS